MSTTKPRITVTLEPRTYEVVSRLSRAGGEPMSKIVTQFVELAVPSLERVVVVLERAKVAPEKVRAGLAASIERADRELLPSLVATMDQLDIFLVDAAQAATAAAAPRSRRLPRSAASTPVPVTRGSGGGKTLRSGVVAGSARQSPKGGRRG